MSRPLRVEFAGAVYHVTSRGNGGGGIGFDDKDRTRRLGAYTQFLNVRYRRRGHVFQGRYNVHEDLANRGGSDAACEEAVAALDADAPAFLERYFLADQHDRISRVYFTMTTR